MANYRVVGETVYAKIADLDEKELRAVINYKKLGYKIVEPKEKKEPKEAFKQETIQKWLEENATKEQIKTYWEKYNAPVIDKSTKEPKRNSNGEIKKKGHVATFSWFKATFPNYPEK